MRNKSIIKILSVLLLVGLIFSSAPLSVTAENTAPQSAVIVEQSVLDEIQANGSASYYIEFTYDADLSPAFGMSWIDRGWFVYETLLAQMERSQASVQAYLSNAGVEYKSFWINNSIYVTNSDATVLNAVQTFAGVEKIYSPEEYFLIEPEPAVLSQPMGVEPNLTQIQAELVWERGITGEGYTVASIDTGVRYTHEALVNAYRGNLGDGNFDHNYNWLDPNPSSYQAPRDDNGHGSHTMGTMVGDDGGANKIGVAPGANWMACRGCTDDGCPQDALLGCAQFLLVPTKLDGSEPDADKRPVAVNNSWGNCQQEYNGWFQTAVDAWVATGILPSFSNGNNSNCGYPSDPPENTVGNPARYGNVSGVGSSGKNNGLYAPHSNKGPSDVADELNPTAGFEFVKPQFIAPGVSIRSSLNSSDTIYGSYSGTSMSAPHVTAAVALIAQAAPCLAYDYAEIETILEQTAEPVPHGSWTAHPNNATGWGEIRLDDAVEMAMGMCGDYTITGTVTGDDAGNTPLAGASVLIVPDDTEQSPRTVKTNEDGVYNAMVDFGTFVLTASMTGYVSETKNAEVEDGQDEATVVDFTLEALPAKTITGTVTDGGQGAGEAHGYPLMATLVFAGPDHSFTVQSDPFTGKYEVTVYDETDYTVSVTAANYGYQEATRELIDADGFALIQDFELLIDIGSCSAPGYGPAYDIYYDFESGDEGFTSGGANSSWAWGSFTSGPGTAHSGAHGIATNPSGNYNMNELSWMVSPEIDLGTDTTKTPIIEFWNWLFTESDTYAWDQASVQVTKDGGANWITVYGPTQRQDTEWSKVTIVLDPSFIVNNFQIRFYFKSDISGVTPGWYVDDLGISLFELPEPTVLGSWQFDGDDATTFVSGGTNSSWQQGAPTSGPGAAKSMPNVWATNLAGNYGASELGHITSPVIDLTDVDADQEIVVEFYDWLSTESTTYTWDHAQFWVTGGGGTFTQIWGPTMRQDLQGSPYSRTVIPIPDNYRTENFQFRFQFKSDSSGYREGWYIDDVAIQHSDAFAVPCVKINGGAVAGYVIDANIEEPTKLIDATVSSPNNFAKTAGNDFEPANGLYWFFEKFEEPTKDFEFTVSKRQYETLVEDVTVVQGELTRHDFELGSGLLVVTPEVLERTLWLNDDAETAQIQIKNLGTGGGNFTITEVNKGFEPLAVNIPAFTGELQPDSAPISPFKDTSASNQSIGFENQNASVFPFELMEGGPMAYAVEIRSTDSFYRIPDITVPGTWERVAAAETYYAGDFLGSDFSKIYAVNDANVLYTIDTETGVATQLMPLTMPVSDSLTGISGANGFFYGLTTDCGGDTRLVEFNPNDGDVTVVVSTSITCGIDLAYNPDNGLVYVVDISTDHLYSIDPISEEVVDVGALGFDAGYAQGMDYDEDNGILYWAAYGSGGNGQLRVIDMETGASALVGPFPGDNETDCLSIAAYSGGGGGAVPWLDEDPVEGYVAAEGTGTVNVTFTVRDIIDQPGDYLAELRFSTDTPHDVEPIQVIMHVWRPVTWGNIKGNVTATEKCDINPAPMPEALIKFYRDGEFAASTETDENGYYSYSLERGTYDVEVVMDGYVTARVDGVVVVGTEDVVVDLQLRHDSACLTYTPEFIYAEHYPDQISTQFLTFTNTGAQDAIFEIVEIPGDGPVPFANKAAVELILDDGQSEDAIGIGGTAQFIAVNRFTPDADQFPFTLTEVWVEGNDAVGDRFEVYIYKNTTGSNDPAPGSEFLYKQAGTFGAGWTVVELNEPVTFEGPGDVLIGVGFLEIPGVAYFPAAIDESATKQRSWAGWWAGDIPSTPTLPPNDTWILIDSAGFPGNWMIRGYGETGGGGGEPADIPWLAEDPTAGVVFADGGVVDVTLTFDSTDLAWGDYFGVLRIDNAPDPRIEIPVQLRVLPFNIIYLPLIRQIFN